MKPEAKKFHIRGEKGKASVEFHRKNGLVHQHPVASGNVTVMNESNFETVIVINGGETETTGVISFEI